MWSAQVLPRGASQKMPSPARRQLTAALVACLALGIGAAQLAVAQEAVGSVGPAGEAVVPPAAAASATPAPHLHRHGPPPEVQPTTLARCMQRAVVKQGGLKPPLSWEGAMADQLGDLQAHAMMWSAKPPSSLPVTVVTQLSVSRLPQLYAQCKSWPGPLSAAVYVPLLDVTVDPSDVAAADTDDAEPEAQAQGLAQDPNLLRREAARLRHRVARAAAAHARRTRDMAHILARRFAKFPNRHAASQPIPNSVGAPQYTWVRATQMVPPEFTEYPLSSIHQEVLHRVREAVATVYVALERSPSSCHLDVMLVFEVVADIKSATLLYPVNQLRNFARLQARTELIAQLDVDMLMSAEMVTWLRQGSNAHDMIQACKRKTVFVLPAFEAHGANIKESALLADKFSRLNKPSLERMVEQGLLSHFDARRFPQGHNTTDFPRWFKATESYAVDYTYRFEPWLVLHRTLAPWHDVRFRGYGNNKIQQVCHLNSTGYEFRVHPAGFLIHRAHPFTDARKQLVEDLVAYRMHARRKPAAGASAATDDANDFNVTLFGHTKLLFEGVKAAMDAGTFAPRLDMPTQHCSHAVPWAEAGWSAMHRLADSGHSHQQHTQ